MGPFFNDIAMFSIESPIKRNATIQMIVRKTPNSERKYQLKLKCTHGCYSSFSYSQKNYMVEKTLMWEKKSIVVSVSNCQVNWHFNADLKVSKQESESQIEIERKSGYMQT